MCELFGVSSQKGFVINEYLKEFFSHSDKHPHGWGLVCLEENEAFIEKEPLQASKSSYLQECLTRPIDNRNVFAHIRYATIGNVDYRNCHPYTRKDINGRRWTMVHNGTIFDYWQLDKYFKLQDGDTDSERILMYFVDQVNEKARKLGRELEPKERFSLIDEVVSDMAKGNKLNLIMYDGEYTYVHTNYRKSLYYLEKEEGVIFSTQPLGCHACRHETPLDVPLGMEDWKLVSFTRLLVYCDGKLVYSGTDHGNEYLDNEENMKFLYQTFSNL